MGCCVYCGIMARFCLEYLCGIKSAGGAVSEVFGFIRFFYPKVVML